MPNNVNHKNNNNDADDSDAKPSAHNASFNHNSNDRTFTLSPRCLVCALRHHGSDDPDACPYQGDNFCPEWMYMRIRKHNADRGTSPKK